MTKQLERRRDESLFDEKMTAKKLQFNYKKNKEQDQTDMLDQLSQSFVYEDCKDQYWNLRSSHFYMELLFGI